MTSRKLPLSFALALAGAAPLAAQDGPTLEPKAAPQTVPAQVRWSDFDGDGLEDVLAISLTGQLALLLNRGDGGFDEATMAAGLAEHREVELALCADFDGDGLTDLYLGSASGPPKLLRNLGRLAFEELDAGLQHASPDLTAAALDYDRDGKVDLYLSTQAGDLLYHNLGRMRFERVELPFASGASLPWLSTPGAAPVEPDAPGAPGAPGAQRATAATAGGGAAPSIALGSARASAAPFGDSASAPMAGGSYAMLVSCGLAAAAAGHVVDQATGTNCLEASSVPTLDMLYPISQDLFVEAGTGRVGLNTTSPTARLSVNGEADFSGRVAIGESVQQLGASFFEVRSATGQGLQVFDFPGTLAGGWFNGNLTGCTVRMSGLGGNFWDLGQRSDGTYQISSGPSGGPGLTLVSRTNGGSGNVGIATTSPTQRLDVVGNAIVRGPSFAQTDDLARLFLGDGDNWIQSRYGTGIQIGAYPGDDADLTVETGSGKVGIGTATPSHAATIVSQDDDTMRLIGPLAFGHGARLNFGDSDYVFLHEDTDDTLQIESARTALTGGNVGIGTLTPGFKLEVNGTAGKPGGGSWSVSSDARLKKNVRELGGALDTLLALRGVSFEYIDPEAVHELPGERIGFIATEVEEVLPDWVEEIDGYKRLTVRGFEALAVEALRELEDRNAELREQNAALRGAQAEQADELDALRAELAELRASVAALAAAR